MHERDRGEGEGEHLWGMSRGRLNWLGSAGEGRRGGRTRWKKREEVLSLKFKLALLVFKDTELFPSSISFCVSQSPPPSSPSSTSLFFFSPPVSFFFLFLRWLLLNHSVHCLGLVCHFEEYMCARGTIIAELQYISTQSPYHSEPSPHAGELLPERRTSDQVAGLIFCVKLPNLDGFIIQQQDYIKPTWLNSMKHFLERHLNCFTATWIQIIP